MLRAVTRAEAEVNFRELIEEVSRGETVIITAEGQPPVRMERVTPLMDEQEITRRREAKQRLLERIRQQPALHLGKFNRDDAYDD